MPCNDVVLDVWVGAFPEYVCDPVLGVVAEWAHCGLGEVVVVVVVSLECLFPVPYLAVVHFGGCSLCCYGVDELVWCLQLCCVGHLVGCNFHVEFVVEPPCAFAFI